MRRINKNFLIWFVGFWEGEGWFSIQKKYHNFSFGVSQIDIKEKHGKKIIHRIKKEIGCGFVRSYSYPHKNKPNIKQDSYRWDITHRGEALDFIPKILPFLKFRKEMVEKKLKILEEWDQNSTSRWTKNEENFLKKHYKKMSNKQLSKLLPRHDYNSILGKAYQMRRKRRHANLEKYHTEKYEKKCKACGKIFMVAYWERKKQFCSNKCLRRKDEKIATILELVDSGKSVKEQIKEYDKRGFGGVCSYTRWKKRLGLVNPVKSRFTIWNKEDYEKTFELRERGETRSRISRITGVPKGTIDGWFAGKVPFKLVNKTRVKIGV